MPLTGPPQSHLKTLPTWALLLARETWSCWATGPLCDQPRPTHFSRFPAFLLANPLIPGVRGPRFHGRPARAPVSVQESLSWEGRFWSTTGRIWLPGEQRLEVRQPFPQPLISRHVDLCGSCHSATHGSAGASKSCQRGCKCETQLITALLPPPMKNGGYRGAAEPFILIAGEMKSWRRKQVAWCGDINSLDTAHTNTSRGLPGGWGGGRRERRSRTGWLQDTAGGGGSLCWFLLSSALISPALRVCRVRP